MSTNNKKNAKICILVLDGKKQTIEAQYNPSELSFSKSVGWTDDSQGVGTEYPPVYFTSGKPITLSIELLFYQYEQGGDVRGSINALVGLAHIDPEVHRPPRVQLVMGSDQGDVLQLGHKKTFTGVVESANAKYTMFTSDGIPCRGSVTVQLKQADEVGYANAEGKVSYNHTETGSVLDLWNKSDAHKEALAAKGYDPTKNPNEQVSIEVVTRQSDTNSSGAGGSTEG